MKTIETASILSCVLSLCITACGGTDGVQSCGNSSGDNTLDGAYCAVASDLEFSTVRVQYLPSSQNVVVRYGVGAGDEFGSRLVITAFLQPEQVPAAGLRVPPDRLSATRITESGSRLNLPLDSNSQGLVFTEWQTSPDRAAGTLDLLINLTNDTGTQQRPLTGTFAGEWVDLEEQLNGD